MMSFYKRSFHSFLGFTAGGSSAEVISPESGGSPPFKCGLGLISSMTPINSPHVFESSIPRYSLRAPERRDLPGIGFSEMDDGLMSCTECLGFESYDERRVSDTITCHAVESGVMTCHAAEEAEAIAERMKKEENVAARIREKTFPPPLSSLVDAGGKRWFYLRRVRKEGKLEISQVIIQRPEILRASRENGRLRLDLVDGVDNPLRSYNFKLQDLRDSQDECADRECNNDMDTSVLEHSKESEENCVHDGDDDDRGGGGYHNDSVNHSLTHQREMINGRYCEYKDHEKAYHNKHTIHIDDDDYNDDDDEINEEWRYSRCHEVVMSSDHHDHDQHHHHACHPYHHNQNMQFWSQRYVTTR